MRIIEAVTKRLEIPMDKVLVNIEHYGNTSAASIALAMWDFEKKLKKGDNVILTYDDASTQTADMSEVEIQFDNATGINSVQVQPKQAYTPGKPTYSLAGQRVKNLSKGIYVQDGKKVIVK